MTALLAWAHTRWHIVEARAVVLGFLGRPGGPEEIGHANPRLVVAFIEGLLREDHENYEELDKLYDHAKPRRATPAQARSRAQEIEDLIALAS